MSIILKDYIPVCQRARRLSCFEKLQVNDQIDDWLQQGIIRESCSDYCSPIVLYKKVNGAMKTSSVDSTTPSRPPLNLWRVNIVGSRCSGVSSSPGSGNGRKRAIVLNRRPEL
ncbi:retrovirus-related Pol polyprotein from transposon 17.6 [Trichonephila clavipes]|nr:retrovirus-related Pol polyprotein from transposon 17.6 [Trichonephila clavipes]